jgi:hypothetical protein
MCYLLYQQINNSADSQQILQDLFTAYLATENSSETTRTRAKKIS